MGRRLLAACVVLALGAPEADAATKRPVVKHAAAKVRCHIVVNHKTKKRHKVCVKVKPAPALAKRKPVAAPAAAPLAPVAKTIPTAVPVAASPPAAVPAPLVAPTPSAPAPSPVAAPAPVARLQATTREFSVQLSRPAIAAGSVILELVNGGEDPHDLHVRPAAGGADVLTVDRTDPFGGVTDASGTLTAGSYTLYCSLPGHEAAGMHATLTVK
jgi:plastocyanin